MVDEKGSPIPRVEAYPTSKWRIDKSFPAALIFTLVSLSVSGIWYTATRADMIADHERRIAELESNSSVQKQLLNTLNERTARIEERLVFAVDQLSRIAGAQRTPASGQR